MHAACVFFVFCVSERIRVGRPRFDSAVSRFVFAATSTLALNLIANPTEKNKAGAGRRPVVYS